MEHDFANLEAILPPETPPAPLSEQPTIISDEALTGIYDEILENIRDERKEINDLLSNFADMVINGGDATSSSKEALVNLVKIKSDTSDKMAKVAELMTRVKLRDPFPKYLAVHQTINQNTKTDKRELIKELERIKRTK